MSNTPADGGHKPTQSGMNPMMRLPVSIWSQIIIPQVGIIDVITHRLNTINTLWANIIRSTITSSMSSPTPSSLPSSSTSVSPLSVHDRMWYETASRFKYSHMLLHRNTTTTTVAATPAAVTDAKGEAKFTDDCIPLKRIHELARVCDRIVVSSPPSATTASNGWYQRTVARASLLSRWRLPVATPAAPSSSSPSSSTDSNQMRYRHMFDVRDKTAFGNYQLTHDNTRLSLVAQTMSGCQLAMYSVMPTSSATPSSSSSTSTKIGASLPVSSSLNRVVSQITSNYAPVSSSSELFCVATPTRIMVVNPDTGVIRGQCEVSTMLHQRYVGVRGGTTSQPVGYIADPSTIQVDLHTMAVTRHANVPSAGCNITVHNDEYDIHNHVMAIGYREGLSLYDTRSLGDRNSDDGLLARASSRAAMNVRMHGHMLMIGTTNGVCVIYDLRHDLARPLWWTPIIPLGCRGPMGKFYLGYGDFNLNTGMIVTHSDDTVQWYDMMQPVDENGALKMTATMKTKCRSGGPVLLTDDCAYINVDANKVAVIDYAAPPSS